MVTPRRRYLTSKFDAVSQRPWPFAESDRAVLFPRQDQHLAMSPSSLQLVYPRFNFSWVGLPAESSPIQMSVRNESPLVFPIWSRRRVLFPRQGFFLAKEEISVMKGEAPHPFFFQPTCHSLIEFWATNPPQCNWPVPPPTSASSFPFVNVNLDICSLF